MYFEEFPGAASMRPLFAMLCVVICCLWVVPSSEDALCGYLLFVYIFRFWRCISEDGEDRPSWMTELGFTANIFNAKSSRINNSLSGLPSKLADENSHWFDSVTETLWIVCLVSVPANHDLCEWMYPIVRSVQGSWELVCGSQQNDCLWSQWRPVRSASLPTSARQSCRTVSWTTKNGHALGGIYGSWRLKAGVL